jgi:hypothetical protein
MPRMNTDPIREDLCYLWLRIGWFDGRADLRVSWIGLSRNPVEAELDPPSERREPRMPRMSTGPIRENLCDQWLRIGWFVLEG